MSYQENNQYKPYKKSWDGNKKPFNKGNNLTVDVLNKKLREFKDIFIKILEKNNLQIDEKLIEEFENTATGKVKGYCVAVPNVNDEYLFDKVKRYADIALQKGYTFRNLNITYVEKRLESILDKKKTYIPWAGYNDSKEPPITDKKPGETYFAEKQQGWEEWKPFLKAIYITTYAMLNGEDQEGPVSFVIAQGINNLDNSPEKRDMSRIIKIARDLNIPIYDVNDNFEIE